MSKTIKLEEEYAKIMWEKIQQISDDALTLLIQLDSHTQAFCSKDVNGQFASKFSRQETTCYTNFHDCELDLYGLGTSLLQAAQELLHVDLRAAKMIENSIEK
jgi:hypothetical protein